MDDKLPNHQVRKVSLSNSFTDLHSTKISSHVLTLNFIWRVTTGHHTTHHANHHANHHASHHANHHVTLRDPPLPRDLPSGTWPRSTRPPKTSCSRPPSTRPPWSAPSLTMRLSRWRMASSPQPPIITALTTQRAAMGELHDHVTGNTTFRRTQHPALYEMHLDLLGLVGVGVDWFSDCFFLVQCSQYPNIRNIPQIRSYRISQISDK